MNCPNCSQPLPDQARYCPACGVGVEVAARLDVRVDVEKNMGRVVGVQTDAIHGDVYGGDIYQVQVYVLSESTRAQPSVELAKLPAGPYKYLSPYGPLDRAIFKGRQAEIEQVVRRLGEGRLLVLYGPAGVGKTSLLAAGVIPELIAAGALAVHIQDYSRPLGVALRSALNGSQNQLTISLPQENDLPTILAGLRSQLKGTLVLVLDQFESLFRGHIDAQLYAQIMNELVTSLRQVEPEYLRLILSIEDNALVRLSDLQNALPDVFRSFMQLKPFEPAQARAAILEPLDMYKPPPVYLSQEFVDSPLIPDLIDLSPEMPGVVYPPHLQIVCHHLFEEAVKDLPPVIDQDLYLKKVGGAEGILAGFLDQTLRLGLGTDVERCNRCLVALASVGINAWVAAEELAIEGLDKGQIQAGLERLEQAGLLVRRLNQQRVEFAFTSPIVAHEVRKRAGPEIEALGQAKADLERGWSGWLAHCDLITPRALGRIEVAGKQILPGFLQSLLLIRSALAWQSSPSAWLAGLENTAATNIIDTLEGSAADNPGISLSPTRLAQAKVLFGIDPDRSLIASSSGFGLLAESAVRNPDFAVRGTAALALQAPDSHQALSRLDWALNELPGGWQRSWRKAELRGLLADEIPKFRDLNRLLPPLQRNLVWLWRLLRSLRRERTLILLSMLGAALGQGAGLGLWRGTLAWLAGSPVPGFLGFVHIIYGILLGAGLSLGLLLGRILRLEKLTTGIGADARQKASWLPAVLGGVGFGLAHTMIFILNGGIVLSGNWIVVGMGFLVGFVLSGLLANTSAIPVHQPAIINGWRYPIVALAFALSQIVLSEFGQRSLAISYSERVFRADFSRFATSSAVANLMDAVPAWPQALAVLDAVFVGLILTVGFIFGLQVVRKIYSRLEMN